MNIQLSELEEQKEKEKRVFHYFCCLRRQKVRNSSANESDTPRNKREKNLKRYQMEL